MPLVWPVLGVSVAVLSIAGLRYWPLALAASLVRFTGDPPTSLAAPLLTGATGHLIGALLFLCSLATAAVIRRAAPGESPLSSARGVTALVVGGGLLLPLGLVGFGWLGLTAAGFDRSLDLARAALRCWGSAGLSVLLIASTIFAWWYRPFDVPRGRRIEGLVLSAALLVSGGLLFPPAWMGLEREHAHVLSAAVFWPAPLMIWAGIRFGPRLCSLGICAIGLLALAHQPDGFATDLMRAPLDDLLFSSALIVSTATAGYYAAAISRGARLANLSVLDSHAELESQVVQRTAELRALNSELQREVEQRREVEASLRQSQARLARAHRIARIGHWEWVAATGSLSFSEEIGQLTGIETGHAFDALAIARAAVASPDEAKALVEAVEEAVQRRQRVLLRTRVRRADGRIIAVDLIGDAIRDASDRLVGVAGTLQDVTERCELEEKLRQSQKLEAIGRLAGGIAHDFNNLLTPILGFAELMGEELGDSPLAADAREIQGAAQRAADLTRQLLTFSRRRPGTPRDVDLNRIVSDMSLLLDHATGGRIELHTRLSPVPAPAHVDPHEIEQVVLNLVVNARDAMSGVGSVTISTRCEVRIDAHGEPQRRSVLAVEDSGPGIDARVRERMFEPFFTTKEVGNGSGLGLSTVHGIIEQAGGEVRVESVAGRGSRFEIWLPQRCGSAPPTSEVQLGSGAEPTLLLTGVEPDAADYVRDALAPQRYRVVEAPDSVLSLGLVRDFPGEFELLVANASLPGKSGVDLVRAVRAIAPDLPALLLAGSAERISPGDLPENVAWLPAPFTPGDLLAAVRSLLERGR